MEEWKCSILVFKGNINLSDCAYCFVTGDIILADEFADNGGRNTAKFTHEFDAWVSKRGQQMLDNAHKTGDLIWNREWQFIWDEWNAKNYIPSDYDKCKTDEQRKIWIQREEWESERNAQMEQDAGCYDDPPYGEFYE